MNAAVVALVLAAPVVKLGPGSGIVLTPRGVAVTTHRVVFATTLPQAVLWDGGTAAIEGTAFDDEKRDLAFVVLDGEFEELALASGVPDGGVRVVTATDSYPALITGTGDGTFEVAVPDAGELAGAALVDDDGRVFGMMQSNRVALSGDAIVGAIDALTRGKSSDHRLRNLGISAAFFLGLSVWWVYRSKRTRY